MSLLRACSGQRGSRTGPDWGVCLEDFNRCPWWRLESRDGRRMLRYRTHEQAERAARRAEAVLEPHLDELSGLGFDRLGRRLHELLGSR